MRKKLAVFSVLFLCLLCNFVQSAVPVPLTGKLIPGPGGTPGSVLAVDGNFAAESGGSTDFGANTTAGGMVLLHDKTLGASWPVRKVITAPAGIVDVVDFGKSLTLDGDTLAVNSEKYIFLYQQNVGGANQWGLVKTITRTGAGIGLDLDGDVLATQMLTATSSSVVIFNNDLSRFFHIIVS